MTEKYPLYQQVLSELRESGSMYSWVPKPDNKGLRLSKDNKGMFLFSRCLNDMDRKQKFKSNNNTWAFKNIQKYMYICVCVYKNISLTFDIFVAQIVSAFSIGRSFCWFLSLFDKLLSMVFAFSFCFLLVFHFLIFWRILNFW